MTTINKTDTKKRKKFFIKKKIIVPLAVIVVIIYFMYPSSKQNILPITEIVTRQDIRSEVITSGRLIAHKDTYVGAQVTGEIKALHVKIGDNVTEGQLIAELDPTVPENNLKKAKYSLTIELAHLNSLQQKLAVAKSDLNSHTILYKNGVTSKSEYNKYFTIYKDLTNNIIQTKANIKLAKLEVDNMTKNFSYTKISAPMPGVVVSVPVEVGQTLNANYSTPTIARIAQKDKMTIKAHISEADIYNIKTGQNVIFNIVGDNSKNYYTTVGTVHPAPIAVSNNTSESSNNTYYYADLDLDSDKIDESFRLNMTVTVHIITQERKNVLAIYNTAIVQKHDKAYVTLLDKHSKQIQKEVQLGFSNGIKTEITAGLKEGDTILRESIALK